MNGAPFRGEASPGDGVELAVLGTVLTGGPSAIAMTRLLRPDDFTESWRGDALTWVREAPGGANSAMPARVPPWARSDLTRWTRAVEAAGPVAYLPEYVRLVVEESVGRTAIGMGVILHAAAASTARTGDIEVLARSGQVLRQVIMDERNRLQQLRSSVEAASPERVRGAFTATRLSADRSLRSVPPPDADAIVEAEKRFVASLVSHPDQASFWTTALGPTSVTSQSWRSVYRAVGRMAEAGRPIDGITVQAEVRRASRVYGRGPDERELLSWIASGICDDPDHWGRKVAAERLRRAGSGAEQCLRRATENPGVTVDDILDTAELLSRALERAAGMAQSPPRSRSVAATLSPSPFPIVGVG